ncbi:MAG: HAMP domain-containing sensor histidine kinase [bacterium]
MQSIKINFFKTIKFKLAILFSIILFAFSGIIILLFNITINNYLSTRSLDQVPVINQPQPQRQNNEKQKDIRATYSDDLESIQSKSLISLPFLAITSFIIGYYIAGIFLKPLNELNLQIDKLKTDNLGSQIEKFSANEIGKTINSFNEMSLRLQSSFYQQSRFVQDASHELRTPLTIVRTNIETVLDDENASKNELRLSMKDALLELDYVTELANDLLTLSRPQSKNRKIENIVAILSECIGTMTEISDRNNVTLKFICKEKNIPILINKMEFIRAIQNIIDNAIKYSKDSLSPEVIVNVYLSGKKTIIEIKDNGRGIPKDEMNNIFDRFYRVDKSRDRDTGGFGLGLSITKKIIEEHGGDIYVKSEKGETVFSIKL